MCGEILLFFLVVSQIISNFYISQYFNQEPQYTNGTSMGNFKLTNARTYMYLLTYMYKRTNIHARASACRVYVVYCEMI